jgi:hypothetical protein
MKEILMAENAFLIPKQAYGQISQDVRIRGEKLKKVLLISSLIISTLFLTVIGIGVIKLLLPFPRFYTERYVFVSIIDIDNLDEEYVERLVNFINSTEIRRETYKEAELFQSMGKSPFEIMHFSKKDGSYDSLFFHEEGVIRYNNRRYVVEDFNTFRVELDRLIQEILDSKP